MTAEPILSSDIIGLTRTAPLSRRGFMTASAATAAGYTLAPDPSAPMRSRPTPSYRKDAADDGWNQMQAWFRKYKVPG